MKCCRRAKHQRMYTRAATADDDGTKYLPGGKKVKKCKNIKKCQREIETRLLPHLVNIFLLNQVTVTTCYSCKFGHSVSFSLGHHKMLMFRPKITLFWRFLNYIYLLCYVTPSKFNTNTFVLSFGKYLV